MLRNHNKKEKLHFFCLWYEKIGWKLYLKAKKEGMWYVA